MGMVAPVQCLINAAGSNGQCNTLHCSDSTTLPSSNHLFGRVQSKPSQGCVPVDLTTPEALTFVLNGERVCALCCVDPLRWGTKLGTVKSRGPIELLRREHPSPVLGHMQSASG